MELQIARQDYSDTSTGHIESGVISTIVSGVISGAVYEISGTPVTVSGTGLVVKGPLVILP